MTELESINMFDCDIYAGTRENLLRKIREDIKNGICNVVFALNPLKVVIAEEDDNIKHILKSADLLIPDGIGIIYAARREKKHIRERITGIDLMNDICAVSVEINASIFIYGAMQENLEQAVENLKKMYPGINISGYVTGYEKDVDHVNRLINESGADILFVACGSPVQEIYIHNNRDELENVKLFLGVGGSVDVISGNVKRAPAWVRSINMEWLYRTIFQPRRIPNIKKIIGFLIKLSYDRRG